MDASVGGPARPHQADPGTQVMGWKYPKRLQISGETWGSVVAEGLSDTEDAQMDPTHRMFQIHPDTAAVGDESAGLCWFHELLHAHAHVLGLNDAFESMCKVAGMDEDQVAKFAEAAEECMCRILGAGLYDTLRRNKLRFDDDVS